MSDEVTLTMRQSELVEWRRRIQEGMSPKVKFDEEGDMLRAAYKERGDILYYLNQRLGTILFVNKPNEPQ